MEFTGLILGQDSMQPEKGDTIIRLMYQCARFPRVNQTTIVYCNTLVQILGAGAGATNAVLPSRKRRLITRLLTPADER